MHGSDGRRRKRFCDLLARRGVWLDDRGLQEKEEEGRVTEYFMLIRDVRERGGGVGKRKHQLEASCEIPERTEQVRRDGEALERLSRVEGRRRLLSRLV